MKGGLMRFPSTDCRSNERRQVICTAAILERLIEDCGARPDLIDILHRARGEVVQLLRSEEQILSRHEALAG
jgi:hypothetical protein